MAASQWTSPYVTLQFSMVDGFSHVRAGGWCPKVWTLKFFYALPPKWLVHRLGPMGFEHSSNSLFVSGFPIILGPVSIVEQYFLTKATTLSFTSIGIDMSFYFYELNLIDLLVDKPCNVKSPWLHRWHGTAAGCTSRRGLRSSLDHRGHLRGETRKDNGAETGSVIDDGATAHGTWWCWMGVKRMVQIRGECMLKNGESIRILCLKWWMYGQ